MSPLHSLNFLAKRTKHTLIISTLRYIVTITKVLWFVTADLQRIYSTASLEKKPLRPRVYEMIFAIFSRSIVQRKFQGWQEWTFSQ